MSSNSSTSLTSNQSPREPSRNAPLHEVSSSSGDPLAYAMADLESHKSPAKEAGSVEQSQSEDSAESNVKPPEPATTKSEGPAQSEATSSGTEVAQRAENRNRRLMRQRQLRKQQRRLQGGKAGAAATVGEASGADSNDAALVTSSRREDLPSAIRDGGGGAPPLPPSRITELMPFPAGPSPDLRPPGRRKSVLLSFALFVLLPTFVAILYFGILASDQYASTAQFVVKTKGIEMTTGGMSGMGGMSMVNPTSLADMLIVQDYVASQQVLVDLEPLLNLRELYSTSKADWFARLKEGIALRRLLTLEVFSKGLLSPISQEDLLSYWNGMASVKFDMTTGIATLQVKAFTPEDSQRVASAVLQLSEELVNKLSDRSLDDSLKFARAEVAEAQDRAIKALDALQSFQQESQEVSPEAYALARSEIQSKLDSDLSVYQSQLNLLRRNLPENAPGIQQLKKKIDVVSAQIRTERIKSTVGENEDNSSASQVLNEFAKKKLEVDFATDAYVSALEYLEAARATAMQQSRYLEAFVRPQVPEDAAYPQRLQAVLITLIASAAIWAIGLLFIAAAKEHV